MPRESAQIGPLDAHLGTKMKATVRNRVRHSGALGKSLPSASNSGFIRRIPVKVCRINSIDDDRRHKSIVLRREKLSRSMLTSVEKDNQLLLLSLEKFYLWLQW
jgi:hypothetical protein